MLTAIVTGIFSVRFGQKAGQHEKRGLIAGKCGNLSQKTVTSAYLLAFRTAGVTKTVQKTHAARG
jgi:hypothetical protein